MRNLRKLARPAILTMLVGIAIIATPISADYAESEWRSYKSIEVPAGLAAGDLVEVPIDGQTFEHAANALADLRIADQNTGDEVQYKLLVERSDVRRSAIATTMRDLASFPGDRTQFVLQIAPGVLHNELELQIASQNFQRGVTVESSVDGTTWAMVESSAAIFDFTIAERGVNTRATRVRYPSSTAPFLRITIADQGEPSLDVRGALAFFVAAIHAREVEWPTSVVSRTVDSQTHVTHTILDLGGSGRPTSRIDVRTTQTNFYRDVHVAGSNDLARWNGLRTSTAIYSFDTPRFVGSARSIGIPESTFRYYRITVIDEDNPPLSPLTATAYGASRKLIFQAQPSASYRLYYGNPEARTPSYELEHILPYLVTDNLPAATLGTHTANPAFEIPPEPEKPFSERFPWLFPSAIAVGSLLVGLFLTRLWVQVKQTLPPPPPASV
jgi:hypothetical protein